MHPSHLNDLAQKSLAIIMGGGAGTRLYPLTKERAKPAVPLGGKYRLVDIPISNCLNSGLRQMYVLTQFNTTSLHQHIYATLQVRPFFDQPVVSLKSSPPSRRRKTPTGTRAPPTPCGRTCAISWNIPPSIS